MTSFFWEMRYFSENILGVVLGHFHVEIVTGFASFPEFIGQVIEHGSSLLHHAVTFLTSCHRFFDFKPPGFACRPESIRPILKFSEGISDYIYKLDRFTPVLLVAYYARSGI